MRNLNELAKISNQIANEKGWWDSPRSKAALTLLMQSEVAEALEDYRKHKKLNEIWYEQPENKPCGIPTELADVIIRIADYFGQEKLDLESMFNNYGDVPVSKNFEECLADVNSSISGAWNSKATGYFLVIALKHVFWVV